MPTGPPNGPNTAPKPIKNDFVTLSIRALVFSGACSALFFPSNLPLPERSARASEASSAREATQVLQFISLIVLVVVAGVGTFILIYSSRSLLNSLPVPC